MQNNVLKRKPTIVVLYVGVFWGSKHEDFWVGEGGPLIKLKNNRNATPM